MSDFTTSQLNEFREAFALYNAYGSGLNLEQVLLAFKLLGIDVDKAEVEAAFNHQISHQSSKVASHETDDQSTKQPTKQSTNAQCTEQSQDQSDDSCITFDQFLCIISETLQPSIAVNPDEIVVIAETLIGVDSETIRNSIDCADIQDLMAELELGKSINSSNEQSKCDITPEEATEMIKAASVEILTHTIEAYKSLDGNYISQELAKQV